MMFDLKRAMELDALEAEDSLSDLVDNINEFLLGSENSEETLHGLRKLRNKEEKEKLWRYKQGPLPTDF